MTALEESQAACSNQTNLASGAGYHACEATESPLMASSSSDAVDVDSLRGNAEGDPAGPIELVYVREKDLGDSGEMEEEEEADAGEMPEGFGIFSGGEHVDQGNHRGDGDEGVRICSSDLAVEGQSSESFSKEEEVEKDEATSELGLVLVSHNVRDDMIGFEKRKESMEDSYAEMECQAIGKHKLTVGIVATSSVSQVQHAGNFPLDFMSEFKSVVGSDGDELNGLEGNEMEEKLDFYTACVSEAGNVAGGNDKFSGDEDQEMGEKDNSFWPRAKANISKNDLNMNSRHHESSFDVPKLQKASEIKGKRLGKRCYSRIELEILSSVDVGEQQRRWKEIHQGLGSVVAREYSEISMPNNQKQVRRNNDRRQRLGKKKEAAKILGELFVENIGNNLDVPDPFELGFSGNDCNENCTVVEQPCNEDDDSEDEYIGIQKAAFLVEGEPDFESGPPQDGLEYLRRVRWEAAQIPKVKVAKLDISKCIGEQTPYMPKIPDIPKCPENLLPLKHWEDAFVADFSKLRQAFSRLENSIDGSPMTLIDEDICEQSDRLQHPKNIPTVKTILGMDVVCRAAMLRNRISTFESASVLSSDTCLWLFVLCVAVDTPLNADMSASLRCLLRKCSSLLSRKSEQDDEVAMLNILLVISGKYFGQSEN